MFWFRCWRDLICDGARPAAAGALDLKWNRKNNSSLGILYDHVRAGTVVIFVRFKFANNAFSVATRAGIARKERAMWIIKFAFGKSDNEKV